MKTSIFDMTFTLPPMVEMTEVEKDMMALFSCAGCVWPVIVRRTI